jgi:DNA replication protein DnaC
MCKTIPYRRELTRDDLERMKVPVRYWNVRFDEISDVAVGDDPSPREMVRRYIACMSAMRENGGGMVFYGPNGTGKTSACVYIAKEYRRRGYTVLFLAAADLKRLVIDKDAFDDDETWWARARDVDVLIIDDLGKETLDATGFGAGLFDELIRARNSHKLVTFITSNLLPKRWEKELELRASTAHVLKECTVPVKVTGDDKRVPSAGNLNEILLNG